MTCVLHTARISNVDVIMNCESCGDIEFRFDNLCGSHYQSLVNCESTVDVLVSGRWPDWSTNSRCY